MNNIPLGEIRKALKEAHEHDLDADPMPWPGNANLQYWVGDHYDGIGAFVTYEDAYLAANAPTWLRSLLEERESHGPEGRNYTNAQVVKLREELEQVKKERDELRVVLKGCEYWHKRAVDELASKDKVLGWYANENNYTYPPHEDLTIVQEDYGERARSILSRYARSGSESTEIAQPKAGADND